MEKMRIRDESVAKLVFERWVNAENEAYSTISLVDQRTAQIRSLEQDIKASENAA